MYRMIKSPLAVQLEITSLCNHSCIHCYNHWRTEESVNLTMTEGQLERVILDAKTSEVVDFLITGGEPLLFPKLLAYAFRLLKKNGFNCSVNSNLTLVTEEIALLFKKYNVHVLTSLLSFDKKLHDQITCRDGSFNRLLKGIKFMRDAGVSVGVNMVVMQSNMDQVYKTGCFVKSLGINGFRATKVHPAQTCKNYKDLKLPPEKIIPMFDDLLELRDKGMNIDTLTTYPICLIKDMEKYGDLVIDRGCSAGKTGCTIGANGQVRPCGHSDMEYGSVFSESLLDIWPRLSEWSSGSYLPNECKECKYVILCSGGCRMDCKYFGEIIDLDPYATSNDFTFIPPKSKDCFLLNKKTELVVNPAVKYRTEEFGNVLVLKNKTVTIVTLDTVEFLKSLGSKIFTLDSVFNECNIELKEAHEFLSDLFKLRVIIEPKDV